MNFFYQAFALIIESEIECPELLPVARSSASDVLVRVGTSPSHLEHSIMLGDWIEGCSGQILLKIADVADFWVCNGREITVNAVKDIPAEDVRIYLLGSAMGAVLHQRKLLPFHGSTVVVNEKTISFSGPSGIGKSTDRKSVV